MSKTIIAGGRHYELAEMDIIYLSTLTITEVISGGAAGADRGGELYAKQQGIPVKVFPANWRTYGSAAGPIRNRAMAQYADAVVLFPGGRGTESMHREAQKAGLVIHDLRGKQ